MIDILNLNIKPVKDFPGYWITDCGRVFSSFEQRSPGGHANGFKTVIHDKPIKELKQYQRNPKTTHMSVRLIKDGGYKNVSTHVLVLEHFCGERPMGYVSRHLDGNPENNHISNLQWSTQKENLSDRKKHGTLLYGERASACIYPDSLVNLIKCLIFPVNKDGSIRKGCLAEFCKTHKISPGAVQRIRNGKNRRIS